MPKSPTPEMVAVLAERAGLDLPEAIFQELLAAYGNVRDMIDALPASHVRAAEPAHIFVPAHFRPEGK
jgi:hypothetical protein